MKRSLSLILALLMVLTSMSFTPAKANDVKYILADSDGEHTTYSDADELVRAINAIADDNTKTYTLTLNDDLELSEGLTINNSFNIIGADKSVKIKAASNFNGQNMITVTDSDKDKIIKISNLTIQNEKVGSKFIDYKNFTIARNASKVEDLDKNKRLEIIDCDFTDSKSKLIDIAYIKFNMKNCNFNDNFNEGVYILNIEMCDSVVENCKFERNTIKNKQTKLCGADPASILLLSRGAAKIINPYFKENKSEKNDPNKFLRINEAGAPLSASDMEKIEISGEGKDYEGYGGLFENNDFEGFGAILLDSSPATIDNIKFKSNKGKADGAICIRNGFYGRRENLKYLIKNSKFEKNDGDASGAVRMTDQLQPPSCIAFIKNVISLNLFNLNNARARKGGGGSGQGSGYNVQSADNFNPKALVEFVNCEFVDNTSRSVGAVSIDNEYNVNVSNSIFNNNKAIEGNMQAYTPGSGSGRYPYDIKSYPVSGGAIRCIDSKLTIDSSEFTKNYASRSGGAIYYVYKQRRRRRAVDPISNQVINIGILKEYTDPQTKNIYSLLQISDNVIFNKNVAGYGFYNPPKNYQDFTKLQFKQSSLEGKLVNQKADGTWFNVRSILNNYDVNYLNPVTTTTYDADGRGDIYVHEAIDTKDLSEIITEKVQGYDGQMYDYTVDCVIKDRDVNVLPYAKTKLPQNIERTDPWTSEADGSGETYQAGKTHTLKGNFYAFASSNKPEPSTTVILTLDENYRGGKITDKDVMIGDMIEPHLYKPKRRGYTFKGWSYNKKHLDKVHYDDRIYEPTTVYAIWDEIKEEPEEIKGQEHKAYIFGYPDGTVRPNGEITRAEAAAMLARLLEIESIGSAEAPSFPDTPSAWYNKAINAVVQRGIMKGYPDGTFKPNDAITRAEFTQMISTIDNKPYGTAPFADVVGHWAERPIGSEYQAGRILGYPDGTFRPDAHITRCEAAVILNKIFERNFDNMSLMKCKNPMMIKYFVDLDASFWGYNDMVEATNTHEYIRRYTNRVEENWLLIK